MKLQSFLKWDNSIENVDKAISACKTKYVHICHMDKEGIEMKSAILQNDGNITT